MAIFRKVQPTNVGEHAEGWKGPLYIHVNSAHRLVPGEVLEAIIGELTSWALRLPAECGLNDLHGCQVWQFLCVQLRQNT